MTLLHTNDDTMCTLPVTNFVSNILEISIKKILTFCLDHSGSKPFICSGVYATTAASGMEMSLL